MDFFIDIIFIPAIIISGIYTLIAFGITIYEIKFSSKQKNISDFRPPISILKPIKGIDDQLEANLKSYFELEYSEFEILFGLSDEKDPAIPIIQKLQRIYPKVRARLIVNNKKIGYNPKINNLSNIYPYANFPFLLISDSNVRVEKDYLDKTVSNFSNPETGLVTSTIRGISAVKMGALFENIHLNTYITPAVFFIRNFSRQPITIGKSILLKKEILEKIGGFQKFSRVLAEDHCIGEEINRLGLKGITTSYWIDNVNQNWNFSQFLNRHIRWAKMRRSISEFYYLIEIFSNPIAIGFTYFLLQRSALSIFVVLLTIFFKISFDFLINKLLKSDVRLYQHLWIPVKDLTIAIIWYTPYLSRKINWRGNEFKIYKNTDIIPYTKGV